MNCCYPPLLRPTLTGGSCFVLAVSLRIINAAEDNQQQEVVPVTSVARNVLMQMLLL